MCKAEKSNRKFESKALRVLASNTFIFYELWSYSSSHGDSNKQSKSEGVTFT